jgi:hypothetical protein
MEIFNTDHPKYIVVLDHLKKTDGQDMIFRLSIPLLGTIVLEEHLS